MYYYYPLEHLIKKIDATNDFKIVGAYPKGHSFDMHKGNNEEYDEVKEAISNVPLPQFDPVEGNNGAVQDYWK